MKNKILLIIPCYNESNRIQLNKFAEYPDLDFLFANDGSSDNTVELIGEYAKKNSHFMIYDAPQNLGKANVIQAAFQNFKDHHAEKLKQYEWIGYWDADLATPLSEVENMLKFLTFYEASKVAAIWCSRVSRLGSKIKRQMHRHYLGRIFVTIVSNVLDIKVYDSQCGAKLFQSSAAGIAFKDPFISRWIFDVEVLLRLKEENVIEYPMMVWEDIPGSKVKVFKEAFRVLKDLYRIKKTYQP